MKEVEAGQEEERGQQRDSLKEEESLSLETLPEQKVAEAVPEEPAKTGPIPLFGEMDYCPVCKKSIKNMMNEHGGKILQILGTLVLCVRCGAVFLPKSQIKYVMAAIDKQIVIPPTPSIIVP